MVRDVTQVLVALDEYVVLDACEVDDELEVTVTVARPEAPWPRCGTFSTRVKARAVQRVRDGLSFERRTVLVWHKRRFRCDTPGCRPTFTETTVQVPARARLTTRLRDAVGRRGRTCSTAELAGVFGLSWWTTWRAVRAAAEASIAARPPAPPARLGLDETTFRRPQRFATGMIDLDTGRLWDLVAGRSKTVVSDRLGLVDPAELAAVTDVVIDPFAGYKAAARDLAPHTRHTADRFHIVRLANQAVTDLRCRRSRSSPAIGAGAAIRSSGPGGTYCGLGNGSPTVKPLKVTAAFAADPALELECAWIDRKRSETSTSSPTGTPPTPPWPTGTPCSPGADSPSWNASPPRSDGGATRF